MPSSERLKELAAADEPRGRLLGSVFLTPGPGVTEIFLIRHAQVQPGHTSEDAPLTELGREQAEVLAAYLADTHFDGVYSSPTQRARQTAEPLAARTGNSVQVIDALRDVENRMPRGLSIQEALAAKLGEAKASRRYDLLIETGSTEHFDDLIESSASVRGRARVAVEGVIAAHSGGRAAIFSHGPLILAFVAGLLGLRGDFFYMPRLTSITVVLAHEGRRMLYVLNATPHFGTI